MDMFRTLWPPPARVSLAGRSWRVPDGVTEYIALPNARRPKLLIPRQPRRASSAAVRNFKASASTSVDLRLRALSMAARIGALDLLPDRILVETPGKSPDSDIDAYLSHALQRRLAISFYVGPARAVQKPVLQLLSLDGETLGFAKIGVNDATRRLVQSEAATLESVASLSWVHVTVPQILHRGSWRSHGVLVQQALAKTSSAKNDPLLLAKAMVELAGARGRSTHQLAASPFWHKVRSRLENIPMTANLAHVSSAASQIESLAGTRTIEFGSWHGDWAPWNMAISGDRVLLWDWEHFELGVPVGFDAVHHHIQRAVVVERLSAAAAFASMAKQGPSLLGPFGVAPQHVSLVVFLYLIGLVTGYMETGETQTVLARLDDWLVPELQRQSASLVRDFEKTRQP